MPTALTLLVRDAAAGLRRGPVSERDCAERVSERMLRWAAAFGLVTDAQTRSRARSIRVADLAAATFPRHDEGVLQLGADLILWLYLFDDAIGEAPAGTSLKRHRAELSQFQHCLRTGEDVRGDAFSRSLLDLRSRATAMGADTRWHERFADDMADYFAGCADEAVYRRVGVPPNLAVYRTLRGQTVGTSAVFALAELGPGDAPTHEEMTDRQVQEARRTAAQLTAWVNDLFSYPKEAADADPMNLVTVLIQARDLRPAEALSHAVAIYNAELDHLEAVLGSVRQRFASARMQTFAEDLLAWVHGNRAWTHKCGRYRAAAMTRPWDAVHAS